MASDTFPKTAHKTIYSQDGHQNRFLAQPYSHRHHANRLNTNNQHKECFHQLKQRTCRQRIVNNREKQFSHTKHNKRRNDTAHHRKR